MILYLLTILFCVAILISLNILFSVPFFGFNGGYVFFAVTISLIGVIVIDGIIAFLSHRLPKKCVNPFLKIFLVSKKEKLFYEKLGVKYFKNYLPDLGFLCNFRKRKIEQPKNKEYIFKYLQESCYGEIGHNISAIFGFLVIFILPLDYVYCFGIPIGVVNVVLNIMPTIALRYNRYKLINIYKKLEHTDPIVLDEELENKVITSK